MGGSAVSRPPRSDGERKEDEMYPYLPGAQTEAFKGLSLLLGVMVSLGASGVVGQAVSGLILMYSPT